MTQRADFLKKKLDETVFIIRIYEIHCKKVPTDKLMYDICTEYRNRYSALMKEYTALCDDGGQYDGIQNQTIG